MKKFTILIFAAAMILSSAFISNSLPGENSFSIQAQTARKKEKQGILRTTYRGTKYIGKKTWQGTKWTGKTTWKGTKWTGKTAYKGSKWIGGKTWDGTKWVGKTTWKGMRKIGGGTKKVVY